MEDDAGTLCRTRRVAEAQRFASLIKRSVRGIVASDQEAYRGVYGIVCTEVVQIGPEIGPTNVATDGIAHGAAHHQI
jgi:hypothetical protein